MDKVSLSTIEYRDISSVIEYSNNAKTHPENQVDQIANSIAEFSFLDPIAVDEQNIILEGHGRIAAARKMGLDKVPVIQVKGLTEAQKKAYRLTHNKLTLNSDFDNEAIALELEALKELEYDLSQTGFDTEEIDELLKLNGGEGYAGGTGEEKDDVPDVEEVKPRCKVGEIWQLGQHRILCGDSTDKKALLLLFGDKKAQLCHSDPPYGMGKEKDGVTGDNLYGANLDAFQMKWWNACRPYLEDNASAYIWGNAEQLWRLWYVGGLKDSERLTLRNEIVWAKGDAGAGGISHQGAEGLRLYPQETERCLFFMLGEQGFNNNADNYWDGWESIRNYLKQERDRLGWDNAKCKTIAGHSPESGCHWFDTSQWMMPTEQTYKAWQQAAKNDGFKRDYDGFKRDYDDLKKEWYATRAYFDNTHENMTDVWDFSRVQGEERHGHATPKPVALIQRAIKSSCPENGLIWEPFSGSGSTLIAGHTANRIVYCADIEPKWAEVTMQRFFNLTQIEPELIYSPGF